MCLHQSCNTRPTQLLLMIRSQSRKCLLEDGIPSSRVPIPMSVVIDSHLREAQDAPVPKFNARYGSVPTILHQVMNSSVPN